MAWFRRVDFSSMFRDARPRNPARRKISVAFRGSLSLCIKKIATQSRRMPIICWMSG